MTTIATHTTLCKVTVAYAEGVLYPLTPCCGGSGKGSIDSQTGVVCRECYADVDAMFGDCASAGDVARVASWFDGVDCPDVHGCASITHHALTGDWS